MNYVRRQFNFNRAGSHALHACADPEHFVRGGSRIGPKPPSAHQRNSIVDNGWLGRKFVIFRGSGSILLGNLIFL